MTNEASMIDDTEAARRNAVDELLVATLETELKRRAMQAAAQGEGPDFGAAVGSFGFTDGGDSFTDGGDSFSDN